jgi:hypothetical protein
MALVEMVSRVNMLPFYMPVLRHSFRADLSQCQGLVVWDTQPSALLHELYYQVTAMCSLPQRGSAAEAVTGDAL